MALTDKLTNIADAIREKTGSTRTMNLEEMAAAVTNIKIPTALSDLNEDETHRTVTDAEKKTRNDKSDFSGNYDDLKNKQLAGTTDELTPTQVYAAVSTGKPVKVQYTDRTYGALSFTAFNVAESLNVIVSQTIVYVNGVYILAELNGNKSDNTWGFNATTLAQKTDIPAALPNPNALTFTGAVTGSYDGSAPMTVNIPSGGGGTGGGDDAFELIGEATSSGVSDNVGLTIPLDGSLYKAIIAYAYNLPAGNKKRIVIRTKKVWTTGSPLGWNSMSGVNMTNTWGFFGAAIDVDGKLFTFGAAEASTNSGHGCFRFYPQDGALPVFNLSDCKFISLDCNSPSEILPDGCSLIVWGVRK